MDVIFDIDGTLANPTHRLHFINDMSFWKSQNGSVPKPDWDTFLKDELVFKDTSIPEAWEVLTSLLWNANRIIFVTGRPERSRAMTYAWLTDVSCPHRAPAAYWFKQNKPPAIFMRADGDRRRSEEVKEHILINQVLPAGFKPKIVFEDRAGDTAMWRRNGLLCCQVAEGKY